MSRIILLTGGTGFVGKQILNVLREFNVSVRAVVRDGSESKIANLPLLEKIIATPDVFAQSPEWWKGVCEGVDTIIHVAWYTEPGKYQQSSKNIDCLRGTLDLAAGAIQAKVRRFVGVGTCFEYDFTTGMMFENTVLNPLSPYAAAKAALFTTFSQWFPSQKMEFAWCRLFYLYGEGEDERRLVPYIHARLAIGQPAELTSGNQIRDFLDVRDASSMLVKAALSSQQGAINICSGIPITIRQLAENIADTYGRRDLLQFGVFPEDVLDPPCVVGVRRKQ